jgi:uncharacterized protein YjaZ
MEQGVKIHCLYRDFFVFLRMLNLEGDRWSSFKRYYFEKHPDFLSHVWFEYQGYTRRNIRERVSALKKEDYAQIESELKIFDVEERTREAILHCKDLLHDPDPCNVYLFIGFFSPDGFVTRYRKGYVICVGLERFRTFRDYDILLSHEYCHYILNKRGDEADEPLERRLIREGIAVYFSRLACPGRGEASYFFIDDERLEFLRENAPKITEMVGRGKIGVDELFGPAPSDLPPRTGYFIGYLLVENFVRRTGISDISFLLKEENRMLIDL